MFICVLIHAGVSRFSSINQRAQKTSAHTCFTCQQLLPIHTCSRHKTNLRFPSTRVHDSFKSVSRGMRILLDYGSSSVFSNTLLYFWTKFVQEYSRNHTLAAGCDVVSASDQAVSGLCSPMTRVTKKYH